MLNLASYPQCAKRLHFQRANLAETTFGKRVINDGKLLSRLRSGKTISLDTYNRIMSEISVSSKMEKAS